jgi:hypothetical protein
VEQLVGRGHVNREGGRRAGSSRGRHGILRAERQTERGRAGWRAGMSTRSPLKLRPAAISK